MAKHDPIDHAGLIELLDDRIKAIIHAKGIDISGCAADQCVITLAPIQGARAVGRALDEIVAAIAPLDPQDLFDIIDAQEAAIGEFKALNAVDAADKLILDPEGVDPIADRNQQIVAILAEDQIVAIDRGAELHHVIHRHMNAAPIIPGGAQPLVNDDVIAIADIKLVDVATIAAQQQIISATPIEGLAEVGAAYGLGGIAADQVDILWIEIGIDEGAVGELEGFDSEMLAVITDVLVGEDELIACATHAQNQVQCRA